MKFLYDLFEYMFDFFKKAVIAYVESKTATTVMGMLLTDPGQAIVIEFFKTNLLPFITGEFDNFIETRSASISMLFFLVFAHIPKEKLLETIPGDIFKDHKLTFAKLIVLIQNYLGKDNIAEMLAKYEKDTFDRRKWLLSVKFSDVVVQKIDSLLDLLISVLKTLKDIEVEQIISKCTRETEKDKLREAISANLEKKTVDTFDKIEDVIYLSYLRRKEREEKEKKNEEDIFGSVGSVEAKAEAKYIKDAEYLDVWRHVHDAEAQAKKVDQISKPESKSLPKPESKSLPKPESKSLPKPESKSLPKSSSKSSSKQVAPKASKSAESRILAFIDKDKKHKVLVDRKIEEYQVSPALQMSKEYKTIIAKCGQAAKNMSKMYLIYSGLIAILTGLKEIESHRKYFCFCFLFYCFKTKYNLTDRLSQNDDEPLSLIVSTSSKTQSSKSSKGGRNRKTRKYHKNKYV